MKNKKILIIGSCALFGILILISLVLIFSTRNSDARKFKKEYEYYNGQYAMGTLIYPEIKINKDNIIKYTDAETILKMFDEKKSAVVYIGYSSCTFCRTAAQILLDTASQTKLDTIYYLDISKIWFENKLSNDNSVVETQKASDSYYKLVDKIGKDFLTDYKLLSKDYEYIDTNQDRLEVPLVLFITDGDIVSYHIGTLPSHLDPLILLDQSQIDGLGIIYNAGINDVLSAIENNN